MSRADFKMRLPQETLDILREVAAANSRSVTAEIAHVLERFVADSAKTVKTQLRMPASLQVSISQQAKAAGRSMNAEIVHRLAASLVAGDAP